MIRAFLPDLPLSNRRRSQPEMHGYFSPSLAALSQCLPPAVASAQAGMPSGHPAAGQIARRSWIQAALSGAAPPQLPIRTQGAPRRTARATPQRGCRKAVSARYGTSGSHRRYKLCTDGREQNEMSATFALAGPMPRAFDKLRQREADQVIGTLHVYLLVATAVPPMPMPTPTPSAASSR